jgi:hypothetical protein
MNAIDSLHAAILRVETIVHVAVTPSVGCLSI